MDVKDSFNHQEEVITHLSEEEWGELQRTIDIFIHSDHRFEEEDRHAVQTLMTGAWLGGVAYASSVVAAETSEPEDDGLIHLTLNKVQAKNLIQFFLGEQA